jgi:hypothetical protein
MAVSHTGYSADPYAGPGIKKSHLRLLDIILVEVCGKELTESTAILWIM